MPPIVMKKTGEPTPKDERAASARVQRRGFAHGSEVTGSLIVQFIGCSCGDDILKNLLDKRQKVRRCGISPRKPPLETTAPLSINVYETISRSKSTSA